MDGDAQVIGGPGGAPSSGTGGGSGPAPSSGAGAGGIGPRGGSERSSYGSHDREGPGLRETIRDSIRQDLERDEVERGSGMASGAQRDRQDLGERQAPEVPQQRNVPAAPQAWGTEAKTHWESLPPQVQQAVLKRESDIRRGVEPLLKQTRAYDQSLGRLDQMFQREGVDRARGLDNLTQWAARAVQNPVEHIIDFASRYGVNLQALAQSAAQGQPQNPLAQALNPLQRELMATKQQIAEIQKTQQQTQTRAQFAAVDGHRARWSSDKPHFEQQYAGKGSAPVREAMGDILMAMAMQGVQAPSSVEELNQLLDNVYEQATWGNPNIRQHLMSEQGKQQRAVQMANRERAMRAGASLRPNSPGAGGSVRGALGTQPSVRQSIEAAFKGQVA